MSVEVEQAKCQTPDEKCNLCWACQRKGASEDGNYAEFAPKNTMNGYQCDGYVSEKQGSFDFN